MFCALAFFKSFIPMLELPLVVGGFFLTASILIWDLFALLDFIWIFTFFASAVLLQELFPNF